MRNGFELEYTTGTPAPLRQSWRDWTILLDAGIDEAGNPLPTAYTIRVERTVEGLFLACCYQVDGRPPCGDIHAATVPLPPEAFEGEL